MNAISTSMNGAMRAASMFNDASQRLNAAMQPNAVQEPIKAVTDQIQSKHAFNANLATLKVADDMQKRLLDIIV